MALRLVSLTTLLLTLLALFGCNSKPAPTPLSTTIHPSPAFSFPTRPTTPPPAFKLFHTTKDSITLVTPEATTDEQIESLLYQLHDAATNHTFAKLKLPQTAIDARDPYMWFHIYRGPKCAAEKYAAGAPPCGGSYHAAGDYTLGSFSNPNRDDASFFSGPNRKETHLWNPDAPAKPDAPATPSPK